MRPNHPERITPVQQKLRVLKERFVQWKPWLEKAVGGRLDVQAIGAETFVVVVSYLDTSKNVQTYRKTFSPDTLPSNVRCLKDHARDLVREVLEQRGIIGA